MIPQTKKARFFFPPPNCGLKKTNLFFLSSFILIILQNLLMFRNNYMCVKKEMCVKKSKWHIELLSKNLSWHCLDMV